MCLIIKHRPVYFSALLLGATTIAGLSSCAYSPTTASELGLNSPIDRHPELAASNGYFVSGAEAKMRGGVGNYVSRPTAQDRLERDRLNRISRFSEFTRDESNRLVISLNRELLFSSGSDEMRPEAKQELAELVRYSNDSNYQYVDLHGFADSTGSADMNQDLSLRRAKEVSKELTSRGLVASTVETQGYGEDFPIQSNATVSGRQQNRRVEIVVIK
jgi:outer membrane protein OmpA-like peptidoglycan-associated protein